MKLFTALAALTLIAAPIPAQASDPFGAASAWCMTMDETGDRKKANNAMRNMHIASGATFSKSMFYGRSISKATEYQARRMCPEHFAS